MVTAVDPPEDGKPSASASLSSSASVAFIVTGFGPFRGVQDNPTTQLVRALRDYLTAPNDDDGTASDYGDGTSHAWKQQLAQNNLRETIVMETSVVAVRETLDRISKEYMELDSDEESKAADIIVLLHLGVNYKGTGMKLEECAYNDASFRIPDERGFQPMKECILQFDANDTSTDCKADTNTAAVKSPSDNNDAAYAWNCKSQTKLPLNKICKEQCQYFQNQGAAKKSEVTPTTTSANFEIKTSQDPGRFVCNYTYYYSLETLANASQGGKVEKDQTSTAYSLFLHVPPLNVIPLQQQLEYVADLMKRIKDTVLSENVMKNIKP